MRNECNTAVNENLDLDDANFRLPHVTKEGFNCNWIMHMNCLHGTRLEQKIAAARGRKLTDDIFEKFIGAKLILDLDDKSDGDSRLATVNGISVLKMFSQWERHICKSNA